MNRKNLVLLSKCALLLAFLGFCIPTFDSDNGMGNGFAPIFSLLPSGFEHYNDAKDALNTYENSSQYENNQVILAEKDAALNVKFDAIKEDYNNKLDFYKEFRKPLRSIVKTERKKVDDEIKRLNKEKNPLVKEKEKLLKENANAETLAGLDASISDLDKKIGNLYVRNEDICKYLKVENGTFTADEINRIENVILEIARRKSLADLTDNDRKSAIIKIVDGGKKIFRKTKNAALREAYHENQKICEQYVTEHDMLVKNKKSALAEVLIPIFLIIFVCSLIASVLFSTINFVTMKKTTYTKKHQTVDIILFALIFVSVFYSFSKISKLEGTVLSGVSYTIGFYLIVIGLVASLVAYLFSSTLDENISSRSEERRAYWMLSLPAILFYFAVMTFPAVFSVVLSFTDYGGGPLFEKFSMFFIGFDNYSSVLHDPSFYISLKNNVYVVLISVFGQLPLGFLLAYVLNRGLVKGRDFYQTMIYLPCVISTVVIGILFQTFFSAKGAWTDIMTFFNEDYKWAMSGHPMLPVLFVILWMYTGTYLIIFLANLQKLDPGIIEAATIDGATEGQVLWHVIFPELSGTFVISAILAISGSLKSFDLIYVMTAGGPAGKTYVLALYMFDKAFKGAADYPMANTISTIMVVISLVLIAVVKTLEKKFGATDE